MGISSGFGIVECHVSVLAILFNGQYRRIISFETLNRFKDGRWGDTVVTYSLGVLRCFKTGRVLGNLRIYCTPE